MRIRIATEADAEGIRAIYAPFCEQTIVSFEAESPTVEEMARRVSAITEQHPWLVADDSGDIAGFAYACRHRTREAYQWATEVTVYVDEEARGKGLGRHLYATLFDILTLQGYCQAFGGIALPNPASVGLHESMGFELVGVYRSIGYKLGAWRDVAWYARPLRAFDECPEPPRAFSEICGEPRVVEILDNDSITR